MKKLIVSIALLLVLLSCSKEGEVLNRSNGTIKINGKEYKFIKVVPADGANGVWLLVPSDATVELPILTSYEYRTSCGKNCHKKVLVNLIHVI